jgi:hypothetical protein
VSKKCPFYTTDITPDLIKTLKINMHDRRRYVTGNADSNDKGKQTKFGSKLFILTLD